MAAWSWISGTIRTWLKHVLLNEQLIQSNKVFPSESIFFFCLGEVIFFATLKGFRKKGNYLIFFFFFTHYFSNLSSSLGIQWVAVSKTPAFSPRYSVCSYLPETLNKLKICAKWTINSDKTLKWSYIIFSLPYISIQVWYLHVNFTVFLNQQCLVL